MEFLRVVEMADSSETCWKLKGVERAENRGNDCLLRRDEKDVFECGLDSRFRQQVSEWLRTGTFYSKNTCPQRRW